jgi:phosphonoacetate hydrolase
MFHTSGILLKRPLTPIRIAGRTPTHMRTIILHSFSITRRHPTSSCCTAPSHYWGDQGGHLGEHGSLGVVQARAPFIVAGAGVQALGMVDSSCRLVDVAPTMLELLGCPAPPGSPLSTRLRGQDGEIVHEVVDQPGGARQVVAFLLDGTNPNVLYDLARRGEAPNVSRLMEMGTVYRHGAIASLPTVTLANHTALLTGRHPGHHGILHNAWIDRSSGAQVVTNSPSTWSTSMSWVGSGVETVTMPYTGGSRGR